MFSTVIRPSMSRGAGSGLGQNGSAKNYPQGQPHSSAANRGFSLHLFKTPTLAAASSTATLSYPYAVNATATFDINYYNTNQNGIIYQTPSSHSSSRIPSPGANYAGHTGHDRPRTPASTPAARSTMQPPSSSASTRRRDESRSYSIYPNSTSDAYIYERSLSTAGASRNSADTSSSSSRSTTASYASYFAPPMSTDSSVTSVTSTCSAASTSTLVDERPPVHAWDRDSSYDTARDHYFPSAPSTQTVQLPDHTRNSASSAAPPQASAFISADEEAEFDRLSSLNTTLNSKRDSLLLIDMPPLIPVPTNSEEGLNQSYFDLPVRTSPDPYQSSTGAYAGQTHSQSASAPDPYAGAAWDAFNSIHGQPTAADASSRPLPVPPQSASTTQALAGYFGNDASNVANATASIYAPASNSAYSLMNRPPSRRSSFAGSDGGVESSTHATTNGFPGFDQGSSSHSSRTTSPTRNSLYHSSHSSQATAPEMVPLPRSATPSSVASTESSRRSRRSSVSFQTPSSVAPPAVFAMNIGAGGSGGAGVGVAAYHFDPAFTASVPPVTGTASYAGGLPCTNVPQPPYTAPFHPPERRYSDGDTSSAGSSPRLQGIAEDLAGMGSGSGLRRMNSDAAGSACSKFRVRWNENLICPSPVQTSQKRRGWFNRRGDQLWTNNGHYRPPAPGQEYPIDLEGYPDYGQGWMNEDGVRIDMGHHRIPKVPLRSALKGSKN